jgi:hypothetical protein
MTGAGRLPRESQAADGNRAEIAIAPTAAAANSPKTDNINFFRMSQSFSFSQPASNMRFNAKNPVRVHVKGGVSGKKKPSPGVAGSIRKEKSKRRETSLSLVASRDDKDAPA